MSATLIETPPTHQPQAAPPVPQRRVLLDAARLLAAYAIVWLHVPRSAALASSTALGRFSVPFFTAAAVFFVWESLGRGRSRTVVQYAGNRVLRLYVPFLAWTAAYLLFKVAKLWLAPLQPNDFPGVEVMLVGGHYHLWFLPFIFVVTLAVFAIGKKIVGNGIFEGRLAIVAAMIGTALAVAPVPQSGMTAELWWMALPSAFLGLTLAIAYRHGAQRLMESAAATWLGLAATLLGTGYVWIFGRNTLAETIAGLGFFIFALGKWDGPLLRRLATLGPLAYGIYLAHVLFIKICESVATKLHWSATPLLDVGTFLVAATGSTLIAWLLSRHRYTKWLVA